MAYSYPKYRLSDGSTTDSYLIARADAIESLSSAWNVSDFDVEDLIASGDDDTINKLNQELRLMRI